MKTRTLLVDSNFLLKRSSNGAKNTYTDAFGDIGGLYSFLTTLRKLIKKHSINKVVLCWDGENGGIYRYRIDKEYKANRVNKSWFTKIQLSEHEIRLEEKKRKSLLKQRKRIQAYSEELFLRQIEVDEIEADDLIAAYCYKYNNKEEIIIYSSDGDFIQLLNLNITILFPNIDIPITKKNFFTEFGYHHGNSLPLKIIGGDRGDNIPGIKGLKEGTIFKYFPELRTKKTTVNDICGMAKELNEKRVSEGKKPLQAFENLLNNKKRLKTNYKLINLSKPIINEVAEEELEQLDMPLSPKGRSSKNLFNLMKEDEFLSVFGGTFVDYIEPFYVVIMSEKDKFDKFNKKC